MLLEMILVFFSKKIPVVVRDVCQSVPDWALISNR